MRHGRYMAYGFYGSYILSILVIGIIISLIVVLLYKQRKNPFLEKSMDILKERYVKGEISAEEFREKRAVIEGLAGSNPMLTSLVHRYAKGEINSKDFFVILEQIKK